MAGLARAGEARARAKGHAPRGGRRPGNPSRDRRAYPDRRAGAAGPAKRRHVLGRVSHAENVDDGKISAGLARELLLEAAARTGLSMIEAARTFDSAMRESSRG